MKLLYAILGKLLAPSGQLAAVELFAAQQLSELTMLAGIGFRQNAQLVLGRELTTCALLKLRVGRDLMIGSSVGGFGMIRAPEPRALILSLTQRAGVWIQVDTQGSRPRVSNDNPYSESLFRTVKYCPQWPAKGFASLTAVRDWMLAFEHAYNEQHLHSGIRFVTPADRHRGTDHKRLAQRKLVYERAKRRNPGRWSGNTRNWAVAGPVSLNLGKLQEVER